MQRTQNALFGVLAVAYATLALTVVNRLWMREILASASGSRLETFVTVVMVVGSVGFALTVTNIVCLVIYARSIQQTRAAALASAAWILALVHTVLAWGARNLVQWFFPMDDPLLPTALSAVPALVHWIHVGVFCGSVYRLLGDRGQPLPRAYAVGMVGSSIAMNLTVWAWRVYVTRSRETGGEPSEHWNTLSDVATWGLYLLWMVAITGLVWGARRRLRIAPETVRQVFD